MRRCAVLHSTWLARDELLAFWGEDGTLSSTSVPRRSRHPKHPRPVPHPFALDADGIRLAAGEVGGVAAEDLIVKAREVDLHLRLPGAGGGPIGSPLLEDDRIGFAPGSPGDPLPWTAAGLVLDPFDAARLVLALGDGGRLGRARPGGARGGPGHRPAVCCPRRRGRPGAPHAGRLLPVLERTAQGSVARWRPLVDRHDRGRVEMLCWNLPGSFVCADAVDPARASRVGGPPRDAPHEVLRSYMWSVTDAFARRFVADRLPPAAAARRQRPSTSDAVDVWRAALSSPDADVPLDHDLEPLAAALRAWHATEDTAAAAVRTCFRIPAPDDGTRRRSRRRR